MRFKANIHWAPILYRDYAELKGNGAKIAAFVLKERLL